jgi:hypothetical protein
VVAAHNNCFEISVKLASHYPLKFIENLTDFLVGLFFASSGEVRNAIHVLLRFNFCDAANVANPHSVYCSASDIRSNRIFLAIIFIAIGVIAAMKTEVDLDFMFHKDPDDKDQKTHRNFGD